MKWVVRVAAGLAIAYILLAVFAWDIYVHRFLTLILFILIGVGLYEGIDMSRFFRHDDDDDDSGGGPLRPA
ncbi:hypothetical protein [Aeromicrobium sp. NPDC092404]|uniref:hypothetical protein n=1 Tax=Aeromicrobium sp. NPDC092404 TaxID=3154976 RepID=UPI0034123909